MNNNEGEGEGMQDNKESNKCCNQIIILFPCIPLPLANCHIQLSLLAAKGFEYLFVANNEYSQL